MDTLFQNERHILSQVQYRQIVPIHTIAFNCQDQTANQFLYDLAKQTGGRFHAFKYGFEKETAVEIPEVFFLIKLQTLKKNKFSFRVKMLVISNENLIVVKKN